MKTINYQAYKTIKAYNYDQTTTNLISSARLVAYLRNWSISEQLNILLMKYKSVNF